MLTVLCGASGCPLQKGAQSWGGLGWAVTDALFPNFGKAQSCGSPGAPCAGSRLAGPSRVATQMGTRIPLGGGGPGAPPRPPQAPTLWGTSQEPRPAGLGARPRLPMPCTAHAVLPPPPREQQRWRSLRAGLGAGAGRLSPHSLPADGASRRPCPAQLLLRALSPRASPLFYKGQVPQGTRPSAQNWVLGQASTLL